MKMQFCTSNSNYNLTPNPLLSLITGQVPGRSEQSTVQACWQEVRPKFVRTFENYIGLELSLVGQVEAVFVVPDGDTGKGYSVVSVINDRDPDVRAQIYAREQAIMDDAPRIDFSFRVISRLNRNLDEVIDKAGRLVFQRR